MRLWRRIRLVEKCDTSRDVSRRRDIVGEHHLQQLFCVHNAQANRRGNTISSDRQRLFRLQKGRELLEGTPCRRGNRANWRDLRGIAAGVTCGDREAPMAGLQG